MSTNNPKNDQHHRELISSTLGDAIKIALYTQARPARDRQGHQHPGDLQRHAPACAAS